MQVQQCLRLGHLSRSEPASACADEIKAAASADYDVDHFLLYLKAQDMGYAGSFQEYSRLVWKRDESGKTIEFDLQEAAEKWLEQVSSCCCCARQLQQHSD